jgi:hypothetical protein
VDFISRPVFYVCSRPQRPPDFPAARKSCAESDSFSPFLLKRPSCQEIFPLLRFSRSVSSLIHPCGIQPARSQVSPASTTILVRFFYCHQFSISALFLVPLVISRAGQNSVRDSPSMPASVGANFFLEPSRARCRFSLPLSMCAGSQRFDFLDRV